MEKYLPLFRIHFPELTESSDRIYLKAIQPSLVGFDFYGICYNSFIMSEESAVPVIEENIDVAPEVQPEKKSKTWLIILVGAVIVTLVVGGIILLAQDSTDTPKVRDIFLIFMALESIVIGAALVLLVIQLASLINLLQNEIKPILKSTTDTVNTLKGTTEFLSENLANPVIKLNSSAAGLRKLIDLIGLFKK